METKTGKRIVSKREYVKMQGKRLWLYLCAVVTLLISLLLAGNITIWHYFSNDWSVVLILGTVFMVWSGKLRSALALFKQAQEIPRVTPLTRANIANLPAPDTLVRASSEPIQAQEAVLLRAAAEGQETPPEQLVRASVGKD